MNAITHVVENAITKEDIGSLACFSSPEENAISFYLCYSDPSENAHRREVNTVRDIIRNMLLQPDAEPIPPSAIKDLEELRALAENVRLKRNRLHAIFACRTQHIWREFDLPAIGLRSSLQRNRRFHIVPLMRALEFEAPYAVVLLESGKARAFVVHGAEIREIPRRLTSKDLSLQAQDARVAMPDHMDRHQLEHDKAYFQAIVDEVQEFLAERHLDKLVIGCRDDLWGEIRSQFAELERPVWIGRFPLPSFDMGGAEVLRLSAPLFEEHRQMRVQETLRQLKETPSRSAFGVNDVLLALAEGRVRKLLLDGLDGQTVAECRTCKGIAEATGPRCVFCGSTDICRTDTAESLLRQALLTDAEIVMVKNNKASGFQGTAAWLRY